MRILVTGGAGFIGSNLVNRLHAEHDVVVIDNLSKQIHGDNPPVTSATFRSINGKCNFINGDVVDSNVYSNLGHFDAIVCLAAETGTGQSMYMSEKYCQVNIVSIAVLSDAILRKKLSTNKIVLASSRAVYGDAKLDSLGNPLPAHEDDDTNPISLYAVTKLTQEQLVRVGFGDVDKCILRFQNVYGPGQSLINPYTGIMSIFSNLIQENKTIQIFEDGNMSRDFVYIDDIVSAITLSIHAGTKNEIFNVGSGVRTTVNDLVYKLQGLFGKTTKTVITGQKRIGDIKHNYADITKIKKIGFVPQYSLDDGVKNFVNWVKSQNVTHSNYEESLDELRNNNLLK